jgi:hypothetical protein
MRHHYRNGFDLSAWFGCGRRADRRSNQELISERSLYDHLNFEGRSIVLYGEFESGARRVAIDFDGVNACCKAAVINGRRPGNKLVPPMASGFEAPSVQIGAVSCSIREGNVFAQ